MSLSPFAIAKVSRLCAAGFWWLSLKLTTVLLSAVALLMPLSILCQCGEYFACSNEYTTLLAVSALPSENTMPLGIVTLSVLASS